MENTIMTRARLEQYRALRREVADLERRLVELRLRPPDVVSDSVKGSSPHFPYIEHIIPLAGYSPSRQRKIERLEQRLEARRDKLVDEISAIETFVDSVGDSITRQIVELRIIHGMSWNRVASRTYGYPCGDRARKRFEKQIND